MAGLFAAVLSACGSGGRAEGPRSGVGAVNPALAAAAGAGGCDTRTTAVWSAGSPFQTGAGWFETGSRDRIWLADMNQDGKADVVGISFFGQVLVALANAAGTGFDPPASWGTTVFVTSGNWFTNTYRPRVWVADVTGDGRADVTGIDDRGAISFYRNTGSGLSRQPTRTSPFSAAGANVGDGWFDPPGSANPNSATRIWLADVTRDGKLDVVGISNAGDIWVSPGADNGFRGVLGPFASSFSNAGGWFAGQFHDRIWLADAEGDGDADIIGIAASGQIQVSYSQFDTDGFSATRAVGAPTVFQRSQHWFDRTATFPGSPQGSYLPRVWVADVTGDGKADVVGVAPPGQGDGDVWVAKHVDVTGVPGGTFLQRSWLYASQFKTGDATNKWFDASAQPRVWLADVTGDRRADLVGIAASGDVWAAKAAADPEGGFLPSLRVATSKLTNAGGFFEAAASKRRVWLADVTSDGLSDVIAISPPTAGNTDGDITWTQVFPTAITSISPLPREEVQCAPDSVCSRTGSPIVGVNFSRRVNCSAIPPGQLKLEEGLGTSTTAFTATLRASLPDPQRTCSYDVSPRFIDPGSADVKIKKSLDGLLVRDRWNRPIDGDGNGFLGCNTDRATRIDYLSDALVAGAARTSLDYDEGAAGAGPPRYPAANGEPVPTDIPFQRLPCNPAEVDCAESPVGRVVLLGKGSGDILALLSVEFVGVNPGRLRDLIVARTGIPRANVVVTATHAHSVFHTSNIYTAPTFDDRSWQGPAPVFYDYPSPYPYLQWVEDVLADRVATAYENMKPATVTAGVGAFPSLDPRCVGNCTAGCPAGECVVFPPTNRHDDSVTAQCVRNSCSGGLPPVRDIDKTVGTIAVYAQGNPLAMIVNYGMHPVILDALHGMTSDYTGFLSKCIEQGCRDLPASYPRFPVGMFVQAGGGDMNPGGGYWTNNEALSRDLGRRIAQKAYEAATQSGPPASTNGMSVRALRSIHPLRGVSSCPRTGPGVIEGGPRPDQTVVDWDLESTAVVVGRPPAGGAAGTALFAFATSPGEAFTAQQTTLHAQATTGETRTFLFGYTNGYFGYLSNADDMACVAQVQADNLHRNPQCTLGTFGLYGVVVCDSTPGFMSLGADGVLSAGEEIVQTALSSLRALNGN